MTTIHALILGVVEGIAEFLPVSSTGHLILAASLLKLPETEFLKTFEISIQSGAILAVVILYGKRLLVDRALLQRVVVGFIPTGIIGLAFYKIVKRYLIGNASIVVWSLMLGGIAMILFEQWYKKTQRTPLPLSKLSYPQAIAIGCIQSIAIIPGISRSAATIIGGMLLGLERTAVVEFSFLLALPTMAAATGLDLIKNGSLFSSDQIAALAIGFTASFVMAVIAIRFLLQFIQRHTFTPFGVYRIVVAILFWTVKK